MNFIFSWQKTIFYSLAALVRKILFCHSKIKFISSRPCVISSIYFSTLLIPQLCVYVIVSIQFLCVTDCFSCFRLAFRDMDSSLEDQKESKKGKSVSFKLKKKDFQVSMNSKMDLSVCNVH